MIVREEIFQQQGIARHDARRVEREQLARQSRMTQPIVQTRQDTAQPAFSAPRHTTSNGGGSLSGWLLLILSVLAVA